MPSRPARGRQSHSRIASGSLSGCAVDLNLHLVFSRRRVDWWCSRFNASINALFRGVFIRLSLSVRGIALSLEVRMAWRLLVLSPRGTRDPVRYRRLDRPLRIYDVAEPLHTALQTSIIPPQIFVPFNGRKLYSEVVNLTCVNRKSLSIVNAIQWRP